MWDGATGDIVCSEARSTSESESMRVEITSMCLGGRGRKYVVGDKSGRIQVDETAAIMWRLLTVRVFSFVLTSSLQSPFSERRQYREQSRAHGATMASLVVGDTHTDQLR